MAGGIKKEDQYVNLKGLLQKFQLTIKEWHVHARFTTVSFKPLSNNLENIVVFLFQNVLNKSANLFLFVEQLHRK